MRRYTHLAITVAGLLRFGQVFGLSDSHSLKNNTSVAWWVTGTALQAVCDYMYISGDTKYLSMAEYTVNAQSGPLAWWPEGNGDFRADSTDDTGWWALALVRMYDLTGNRTYLDIAQLDEAYIYSYWNTWTCNGGVIWDIPDLTYKNAISNELYMKLAASLHNRIPGDTEYLGKAVAEWDWFVQSGMINSDSLVNDGLTDDCVNNGETEWSYNQGVILGAAAELYKATQNVSYLDTATAIANAVLASPVLSPNGILTEYGCEPADCDNDQQAFKGIFGRNLAELNILLADRPFSAYLASNVASVGANDEVDGFFGISWAGPYSNATIGTQASVVSLLVANVWQ
ncbi:putative glycosyl hydrolase [Coniella lustricola]|uniref:Putative glycosyl hydrolase n=1 Tax=Coniella lustricola TaxID=2025994 RepID=A0A2T3ANA3_9PEZI|nr:putative glycosyl hydrolase [Coniella lustricola]